MARLKIREIAEERGFSMGLLQRKANDAVKVVQSVWRNDRHDISFNTLIKIAEALGVRVTELIDDERDTPISPEEGDVFTL